MTAVTKRTTRYVLFLSGLLITLALESIESPSCSAEETECQNGIDFLTSLEQLAFEQVLRDPKDSRLRNYLHTIHSLDRTAKETDNDEKLAAVACHEYGRLLTSQIEKMLESWRTLSDDQKMETIRGLIALAGESEKYYGYGNVILSLMLHQAISAVLVDCAYHTELDRKSLANLAMTFTKPASRKDQLIRFIAAERPFKYWPPEKTNDLDLFMYLNKAAEQLAKESSEKSVNPQHRDTLAQAFLPLYKEQNHTSMFLAVGVESFKDYCALSLLMELSAEDHIQLEQMSAFEKEFLEAYGDPKKSDPDHVKKFIWGMRQAKSSIGDLYLGKTENDRLLYVRIYESLKTFRQCMCYPTPFWWPIIAKQNSK